MKFFYLSIFCCFFFINGFAQIQVTTITEPFNGSGGLSLDAEGILHIGDFGDFLSARDVDGQPNNVWQLDKEGNLSVYAPGFIGASGNAFNSQGILYQSDIGASAIYKIENNRRVFFNATGISNPVGLVFDKNDNLYVCNCGNNTIRKITPGGNSSSFSSGTIFRCPNGITIDPNGNLYVSNFSNDKIIKINPNGVPTEFASIDGSNNGHLRYFEPDSTLYVCSHGSSSIYTVDLQGNVTKLAGSGARGNRDGTAFQATFSRPNGIVISKTGDTLYINSSIPVTNTPNFPLNPSVIRMITGVKGLTTSTGKVPEMQIHDALIKFRTTQEQLAISITTEKPTPFNIRIFAVSGQLQSQDQWEAKTGEQEWRQDISTLSKGAYVATLYHQGRVLKSYAFIRH